MRIQTTLLAVALIIPGSAAPLAAQSTPAAPTAQGGKPPQPGSNTTQQAPAAVPEPPAFVLRVQVTLSRFQGEKKISSSPFTLMVITDNNPGTTFRTGQSVPLPGANGQVTYQNVGTSISVRPDRAPRDDGRFRIMLQVDDSSIAPGGRETRGPVTVEIASSPIIKSLSAHHFLLLRDGQTTEFLAATDQINGEVTRIEVTLNVVK